MPGIELGCLPPLQAVYASKEEKYHGVRSLFTEEVHCSHERPYLEFATVKLQQAPVREEQLTAHDSSPQASRGPKPLLLHQLRLPSSFQYHRLVGVRAPCTRRRRPCLWNDEHELLQDVLHVGGTLGCRLHRRGDAVAEIQVAVALCGDELHVCNWLLNSDGLKQLYRVVFWCMLPLMMMHALWTTLAG